MLFGAARGRRSCGGGWATAATPTPPSPSPAPQPLPPPPPPPPRGRVEVLHGVATRVLAPAVVALSAAAALQALLRQRRRRRPSSPQPPRQAAQRTAQRVRVRQATRCAVAHASSPLLSIVPPTPAGPAHEAAVEPHWGDATAAAAAAAAAEPAEKPRRPPRQPADNWTFGWRMRRLDAELRPPSVSSPPPPPPPGAVQAAAEDAAEAAEAAADVAGWAGAEEGGELPTRVVDRLFDLAAGKVDGLSPSGGGDGVPRGVAAQVGRRRNAAPVSPSARDELWRSLLRGTAARLHGVTLDGALRTELFRVLQALKLPHVEGFRVADSSDAACSDAAAAAAVSPQPPPPSAAEGSTAEAAAEAKAVSAPLPRELFLVAPVWEGAVGGGGGAKTSLRPKQRRTTSARYGMMGTSFFHVAFSKEPRLERGGVVESSAASSSGYRSPQSMLSPSRSLASTLRVVPPHTPATPAAPAGPSAFADVAPPAAHAAGRTKTRVGELEMSDAAWFALLTHLHRWRGEAEARLVQNSEAAAMLERRRCVELSRQRRTFILWRVGSRWRAWMRRRYMRRCWAAWQAHNSAVHDSKVRSMLHLGAVMTRLTRFKTFQVWRRLTRVEGSKAILDAHLFDHEVVIPAWDEYYAVHLRERLMAASSGSCLVRNRLRRCLLALREAAHLRQDKELLKEMGAELAVQLDVRLQARVFGIMRRKAASRLAGAGYARHLTSRHFAQWHGRLQAKLSLAVLERCTVLRVEHSIVRRAMEYWVRQQRHHSQMRVLITLRCVLFRRKMLGTVYALLPHTQRYVLRAFNAWSGTVRRRHLFVAYASRCLAKEKAALLQTAFDAWRGLRVFELGGFDWAAAEKVRQCVRSVEEERLQWTAEGAVERALGDQHAHAQRCRSTGYLHVESWLSGRGRSVSVATGVLHRLVLHSVAQRTLARHGAELRTCTIEREAAAAAAGVGGCARAFRHAQHRVTDATDRQVKVRRLVAARQARLAAKGYETRKAQVRQLIDHLPAIIPQFFAPRAVEKADRAAGGLMRPGAAAAAAAASGRPTLVLNEAALLAFLQDSVVENLTLVRKQETRDALLLSHASERVPGLLMSARSQHQLRSNALGMIKGFLAVKQREKVLGLSDICALLPPPPPAAPSAAEAKSPSRHSYALELIQSGVSPSAIVATILAAVNGGAPATLPYGDAALEVFADPPILEAVFAAQAATVVPPS